MKTVFIEVEHPFNWGKFCVGKYEPEEFERLSAHPDANKRSLLCQRGWDAQHIWVMDIETGEGACFRHGGLAEADLQKHKIWVCPMFVHFLKWLYKQDLSDLDKLPRLVKLTYDDAGGGDVLPSLPWTYGGMMDGIVFLGFAAIGLYSAFKLWFRGKRS